MTTLQLTNKNKTFLAGLLKGKKVLEAYHEAGYKGDDTAAYTLKHRLKNELSELVNAKSNLDETLLELDQLDELELTQKFLTMNQKLRIISLKIQALKVKNSTQEPKGNKTFTAFVINRNADKTVTISKPVDAQIVDEPTKQ